MATQEFEYQIEAVQDRLGGGVDLELMSECINQYANEGWRLVTIYSNELGKNALALAGLGVNSTLEQSILVFERRVIPKPQQLTFSIFECNLHNPFVLHSATIMLDLTKKISISVYCPNQFSLSGIECTVKITNVFDNSVLCEPICFTNFEKGNGLYHTSSFFPISLPEHICQSINKISIIVKKYILDNTIVVVDSLDLQTTKEHLSTSSPQFNATSLITQLNSLRTALEIYNYIKQYNSTINNLFTTDIVARLELITKTERMYGNMKKDALDIIKKYIESVN